MLSDSSVVRSIDGLDIGKTGWEGSAVGFTVLLAFFPVDSGPLRLGLGQLQSSPPGFLLRSFAAATNLFLLRVNSLLAVV